MILNGSNTKKEIYFKLGGKCCYNMVDCSLSFLAVLSPATTSIIWAPLPRLPDASCSAFNSQANDQICQSSPHFSFAHMNQTARAQWPQG